MWIADPDGVRIAVVEAVTRLPTSSLERLAAAPGAAVVFGVTSLEAMQVSSRWMGHPDDHPVAELRGYQLTEQWINYPHQADIHGRAWRYHSLPRTRVRATDLVHLARAARPPTWAQSWGERASTAADSEPMEARWLPVVAGRGQIQCSPVTWQSRPQRCTLDACVVRMTLGTVDVRFGGGSAGLASWK